SRAGERAANKVSPNKPGDAGGLGAAAGPAAAFAPIVGTSAPGGLRTVGIPIGKVGARFASVPVIWVGLPSQRGTNASDDSSYLNELYRSQAEKAGIVYVDIWDGFVDEDGKFSPQGPDHLGQTRRLRTSDGVYFTKFGARKLAHYVEREIERIIVNKGMPVALPVPVGPGPQAPNAKAGEAAQRPAAGPVVPLTETRVVSEELMGGPSAPPVAAPAARVPRAPPKGGAVAPPTGRADDFGGPRGVVKAEPAPAEPASPDTAAADTGAKSVKPAQRKSAMDAYAERKPVQ